MRLALAQIDPIVGDLHGNRELILARVEDARAARAELVGLAELAAAGAELIVNLSASPFHVGRAQEREAIFAARARESGVRVALCNMVGGQDELVFDGHSLLIGSDGTVLARAPGFEETLLLV